VLLNKEADRTLIIYR